MTTGSQVVVEVKVDAKQASEGLKAFDAATVKAEAAIEKMTMSMTRASGGTAALEKKLDTLRRSADPLYASTKRLEAATLTLDRAHERGLITDVERARTMDLLRAKYDATAAAAGRATGAETMRARAMAAADTQMRSVVAGVGFGGGATIGFAAVAAIRNFIGNTLEAEQSLAQLEAVLKSTDGAAGMTAASLTDLAGEMQRMTTYGDDAVVSAEAMLLTFTKVGKETFPEAIRTILDMSTAMGSDLKESTIQLGKALNDPVKGITALTKVGVTFTEAQKVMIRSLVDAGDAAGAQSIILRELQTEFGGSAKAARETLGGALTALQNSFGDLFEVSGQGAEDLRLTIERIVSVLADPATIGAVQGFGAAIFADFANAIQGAKEFATVLSLLGKGDFATAMELTVYPSDAEGQLVHGLARIRAGLVDVNAEAERFYNGFGGQFTDATAKAAAGVDQVTASTEQYKAAFLQATAGTVIPATDEMRGRFVDAFGDVDKAAAVARNTIASAADVPLPNLKPVRDDLIRATDAAASFAEGLEGPLVDGAALILALAAAVAEDNEEEEDADVCGDYALAA